MPITVCIVDDSLEVRESIAEYINSSTDFKSLGVFETGEEALEEIPELNPDVVLMDTNMPAMSCSQCMRQLKDKMRQLRAMTLPVYDNAGRIFEALSFGASGYLLKSTRREELFEAVKDMKSGGSPMRSYICKFAQ